MLPNPLHPAVVHFPIVLVFLLPLFAIGAIIAIRKGARPVRAWSLPVLVAAALALSSWVAVQTGESQGERVERVVPEQAIEAHEEGAELFMTLSIILVAVTATGFIRGTVGKVGRYAAGLGALALVGFGASVGHTGGQLVYRDGAASAYTGLAGSTAAATGQSAHADDD